MLDRLVRRDVACVHVGLVKRCILFAYCVASSIGYICGWNVPSSCPPREAADFPELHTTLAWCYLRTTGDVYPSYGSRLL